MDTPVHLLFLLGGIHSFIHLLFEENKLCFAVHEMFLFRESMYSIHLKGKD